MFEYSYGTSILLARTIMENRDLTHLTNIDYFREKLFRRISITSAVIERTSNGDLIGGSLGFMTARDWARFGYLYMHDGWWNGVRILAGFSTLAPLPRLTCSTARIGGSAQCPLRITFTRLASQPKHLPHAFQEARGRSPRHALDCSQHPVSLFLCVI